MKHKLKKNEVVLDLNLLRSLPVDYQFGLVRNLIRMDHQMIFHPMIAQWCRENSGMVMALHTGGK